MPRGKNGRTLATPTASEPEPLDLIPLSTIVGEFASQPTVDALAKRLAADVVYDEVGRRCIPVELAVVLLDGERGRRDAVEAQRAEHRAALDASRQSREERRRQRDDLAVARHLRSLKVDELVAAGLTPVEAMIAVDGPPPTAAIVDGELVHESPGIPRPSSNPFEFAADPGGLIGPVRKRMSRAERKALRDQAAES